MLKPCQRILLPVMLLIFVTGCAPSNPAPISDPLPPATSGLPANPADQSEAEGEAEISQVPPSMYYLSIYQSDSRKVQPELILVESDRKNVQSMYDMIRNAEPEILPAMEEIEKIQVLQLEYENGGKVVKTEDYMYVDTTTGSYIKRFEMEQAYHLDKYTDADKDRLILQIGTDEWLKFPAHILFWSDPGS